MLFRRLAVLTACVVTAVPDTRKGEALVVFYTHSEISRDDLWERLC